MDTLSISPGNSLIRLANAAAASAAQSGSLMTSSFSSSPSSFSSFSSCFSSNSDMKLSTAMVQRTVSEVSSDSSQSLSTLDSRSSSQSDSGSETPHLLSSTSTSTSSSLSLSLSLSSSSSSSSSSLSAQSNNSSGLVKVKPGRKSKSAPEEDPRQKKVRSLERNRAAAMRCREKRKMAIKALEANADEMQKLNDRLQGEVAILRRKVTELKSALLAHKDCPVTLQMKKIDDQPFPIALHS